MIKAHIGKRIRAYRKDADMSQWELAERLKVSRQTISSWEIDRTEPSMQDVQRMAEIFGCTVSDLLGDAPERVKADIDAEIAEYLTDPSIRRLILFAGQRIPAENRDKMINAIIFSIEQMQSVYDDAK